MRVFFCNILWLLSTLPGWLRFAVCLRFPRWTQQRRLRALLRANRDTAWGRRHGFSSIRGWEDWRRQPLTGYHDYREDLDRVVAGEPGRLTAAPVLLLEPTSGSGAATKLIPYTLPLQAEFRAAIDPWVASLYLRHPRLLFGRHYWSVSPATAAAAPPGCRLPVGFPADDEYLGPLQRRLAACLFPVPSRLAQVPDHEAWLFLTILFLVGASDLRLISVWHPSFLSILAAGIRCERGRLAAALRTGRLPADLSLPPGMREWCEAKLAPDPARAGELEIALAGGAAGLAGLWPALQLISCWDQARAAGGAAELRGSFPGVEIQGKGLLATEGVVTIPWSFGATVAALTSHVLEFEDLGCGAVVPLWELREGAEYGVLLTTGGGLYRYRLGDLVRCTGFCSRTPKLVFVSRLGGACDLAGEKLTPEFAERALRCLEREAPLPFAMIAPEADGRGYVLYVEDPRGRTPAALGDLLEAALGESYHYAHARRLGQLRPVRVRPVADGMARYRAELVRRGLKAGDIKAAALHGGDCWQRVFDDA